jgi:uncharacterized protein with HEPN domain
MRDDVARLQDMAEAISKIEARTQGGKRAFADDELLQVWVVHHLQILGEAASHVSEALRLSHPEIPWTQMIGMRHILVHGYFQIDLEAVWRVVERDLPPLRRDIASILFTGL